MSWPPRAYQARGAGKSRRPVLLPQPHAPATAPARRGGQTACQNVAHGWHHLPRSDLVGRGERVDAGGKVRRGFRAAGKFLQRPAFCSVEGAGLAGGRVVPEEFLPKVQIPNQQALICYSDGVERLVIETSFLGEGTNFAWVVPLPSVS